MKKQVSPACMTVMKRLIQASIFLSILVGFWVSAAAQDGPPVPYVDKGACPFECCTYRQWTVDKPTVVRLAMNDSSGVAFRLRVGEKVRGVTGVVVTTQSGIAQVLKNTLQEQVRLKRGDRVFLLTYLGEGFSKAWFKSRIFQAEASDDTVFKITRQPKAVWWVKVRNSKGKIGWSREPDNFGNKDQCG